MGQVEIDIAETTSRIDDGVETWIVVKAKNGWSEMPGGRANSEGEVSVVVGSERIMR